MHNEWGTDNEWRIVANNFLVFDENPRLELVKHIDRNECKQHRLYAKELMQKYGIWEQALQIAKENDLNIQP